jgi:hypothetical protein
MAKIVAQQIKSQMAIALRLLLSESKLSVAADEFSKTVSCDMKNVAF